MKMYLLYEWTEEREGKVHFGIYSTVEKAKTAAQRLYESQDWLHEDLPEGTYYKLEWKNECTGISGWKNGDGDYPYDIEEFEVDTYTTAERGFGEWKVTRHEL